MVVCTDIPGGSVNRVAMKLADEYGFMLVSGVNMPFMLELAFSDDTTYGALAATVASAREQLMLPLAQDAKPEAPAPKATRVSILGALCKAAVTPLTKNF